MNGPDASGSPGRKPSSDSGPSSLRSIIPLTDARALVAKARANAQLDEEEALSLAVEETRAQRHASSMPCWQEVLFT